MKNKGKNQENTSNFDNIICIVLLYMIIVVIASTLIKEVVVSIKTNDNICVSQETKELIKAKYDNRVITLPDVVPICKELLKYDGVVIKVAGGKFNSSFSIHDIEYSLGGYLSNEQPFKLTVKDEDEYIVDFFAW